MDALKILLLSWAIAPLLLVVMVARQRRRTAACKARGSHIIDDEGRCEDCGWRLL